MKTIKFTFLFITTFLLINSASAQLINADKVNWLTIEQALKKQEKEPRKIFIDVYTDWCGWCKKMDATTFTNPVIVKYLNEKYYAVKFNAEQKDPIVFQGKTFVNQNPEGVRNPHDLAVAFLQGKMGYPSAVFIDEKSNLLTSVSGYQQPEGLEPILYFFYKDIHLTTSWEDFQKTFKSEIK